MDFFSKPVSDLNTDDLKALLDDGAQENVRLEFKSQVPSRNETLKKLSSMANTYGGYLVIGAEENGSGSLKALPGVETQSNFKQTLIQWGQGGVYPPIGPTVSEPISAPGDPNRELYVVYMNESLEAPHFLEGRKGAYTRTDEFSERFEPRLATYEEIQHLANRRQLAATRRTALFDRAEGRFRQLIEQDYDEHQHTKGPVGAIMHLAVSPTFPITPLVEQAAIHSFVQREKVPWRTVGYPRGREIVTQHESVLDLHSSYGFSLLEVSTWGQVFYATEIERTSEGGNSIHLHSFLGHVLIFLRHAAFFFKHIGFDGSLSLRIKLSGMRGVVFESEGTYRIETIVSRFDDQIDISLQQSSERLVSDPESIAESLYRLVFFAVNWPDAARDDDSVQALVKWANEYNMFQ